MRRLLRVALALAPLAACTDSTPPEAAATPDLGDIAAASLFELADNARMAGDTATAMLLGDAYAALERAGQSAGTLAVTTNGVTEPWKAVAFRTRVPASCPQVLSPTTPPVCRLAGQPSLTAYSTLRPARSLVLVAPEGSSQVPGPTGPTPPSAAAMLRGTYVDQSVQVQLLPPPTLPGITPPPVRTVPAVWVTTAGRATQTTTSSGTPCGSGTRLPPGAFGRCTMGSAEVEFSLDVTQQRPGQPAGPTRRLAVAPSPVPAVVWELDSLVLPPVLPPVAPLLSRLQVVHASRDSVALALVVRNVGRTPAVLSFATTQRAEFTATVAGTRGIAWTWSAGQAFSTVATQDTIAPDSERRYAATWRRPPQGSYVVTGATVNGQGPRVMSVAPVVVP